MFGMDRISRWCAFGALGTNSRSPLQPLTSSGASEAARPRGTRPLRIVVEHGGHRFLNIGDLAMLEITLGRLRRRWPDAVISVLTADAARLSELFPDVRPLTIEGRQLFHEAGQGIWPFAGASRLWERRLRAWLPWATVVAIAGVKCLKREAAPVEEMCAYVAAVRAADLVVSSGGGYLTDSFPWIVQGVYQTLGFAR